MAKDIQDVLPSRQHACTALLVLDTAQPIWYSINCTTKYLFKVVCRVSRNEETCLNQTDLSPTSRYCHLKEMKYEASCLKLEWILNEQLDNKTCVHRVNIIKILFDAVSTDHFPPFLIGMSKHIQLKRYVQRDKQSEARLVPVGFCIVSGRSKTILPRGNLLECANKAVVSALCVCDGVSDCPGNNPADESKSVCEKIYDGLQSYEISGVSQKCGPLFEEDVSGSCIVYGKTRHVIRSSKMENGNQKTVHICHDGKNISVALLNDMVTDCSSANDEPLLVSLVNNSLHACEKTHQIPCRDGHPRCYNISVICKYNLNGFSYLVPCRTGEHLKNCASIECSMMFKCQYSYCIPWKYICDGKWDCNQGHDESVFHTCGTKRSCSHLFKCWRTQRCVHFGRICDDLSDCPFHDDEYFCNLKEVLCPFGCDCLTFAVFCGNVTVTKLNRQEFHPFEVLFFLKSVIAISLDLNRCKKYFL